jgi:hypothetical protein
MKKKSLDKDIRKNFLKSPRFGSRQNSSIELNMSASQSAENNQTEEEKCGLQTIFEKSVDLNKTNLESNLNHNSDNFDAWEIKTEEECIDKI